MVNRRKTVISADGSDIENPNEIIENQDDTTNEASEETNNENEVVDRDVILQALDSDNNETSAELNVTEYKSETDDNLHVALELKIVKKTMMNTAICRLNKVLILIAMFLCLATAIFVLYFVYVLKGQG